MQFLGYLDRQEQRMRNAVDCMSQGECRRRASLAQTQQKLAVPCTGVKEREGLCEGVA